MPPYKITPDDNDPSPVGDIPLEVAVERSGNLPELENVGQILASLRSSLLLLSGIRDLNCEATARIIAQDR